jgi:hypothetical protein
MSPRLIASRILFSGTSIAFAVDDAVLVLVIVLVMPLAGVAVLLLLLVLLMLVSGSQRSAD